MQEAALRRKFRASFGWKVGVDGSVALVAAGVGESPDTTKIKEPIVGLAFEQEGLMYDLTLEGSKITKLTSFHPETPLLRNLGVDLRNYLCDVLEYVSS